MLKEELERGEKVRNGRRTRAHARVRERVSEGEVKWGRRLREELKRDEKDKNGGRGEYVRGREIVEGMVR